MSERRYFVRWHTEQQIRAKLEGRNSLSIYRLSDISLKGVKIFLNQTLPLQELLKLKLVLSDEFVLNVEAWVIWHKIIGGMHSYGLYFSKIHDGDREKIYQFVRSFYPEEINRQWWKDSRKEGGEKMDDRRIFARFTTQFPLRFLDINTGREGEGQALDISAKGISLLTDRELPADISLEMWLKFSEREETLYLRGDVIWVKRLEVDKYKVGVTLEKANLMGLSRILKTL